MNYYLHQGTRKFNVLGSCYIIPPMKNQNNEPDQPINMITFNNNCKKINIMQFFFNQKVSPVKYSRNSWPPIKLFTGTCYAVITGINDYFTRLFLAFLLG